MTRPHVICHMTSSVDGRVKTRRWSPMDVESGAAYEAVHGELAGDGWICGRVTMAGYAQGGPPPPYDGPAIPRETHVAKRDAAGYAIGLDAHARMNWGERNDITGDHVVMVLSERVADAHLAALRRAGISYAFGGEGPSLDLPRVARTLGETFGIKRLLLEGGGRINGAFLRAGLIDELSLLLAPAVDGLIGTPAVFDYEGAADDATPKGLKLALRSCRTLEGGVVWLRYDVGAA